MGVDRKPRVSCDEGGRARVGATRCVTADAPGGATRCVTADAPGGEAARARVRAGGHAGGCAVQWLLERAVGVSLAAPTLYV